jgi:hypothetical protein
LIIISGSGPVDPSRGLNFDRLLFIFLSYFCFFVGGTAKPVYALVQSSIKCRY